MLSACTPQGQAYPQGGAPSLTLHPLNEDFGVQGTPYLKPSLAWAPGSGAGRVLGDPATGSPAPRGLISPLALLDLSPEFLASSW